MIRVERVVNLEFKVVPIVDTVPKITSAIRAEMTIFDRGRTPVVVDEATISAINAT